MLFTGLLYAPVRLFALVALLATERLTVTCQHYDSQAKQQDTGSSSRMYDMLMDELRHKGRQLEGKADTGCGPYTKAGEITGTDEYSCVTAENVCLERSEIVHTSDSFPPLDVSWMAWDPPDVTQAWGMPLFPNASFQMPPVSIRKWRGPQEAPDDVRVPRFSRCTLPLVLYQPYPFHAGHVMRNMVTMLKVLKDKQLMNEWVTILPALPGDKNQVPLWLEMLIWPFIYKHRPVALSKFSAWMPPNWPSQSTAEGNHTRCFAKAVFCRLGDRPASGKAVYAAAQYMLKYYRAMMDKRKPEFRGYLWNSLVDAGMPWHVLDDPFVLKVVIATNSGDVPNFGSESDGKGEGNIQNMATLMKKCNQQQLLTPTDLLGGRLNDTIGEEGITEVRYRMVACLRHRFGADPVYDMWLVRWANALVGLHGPALTSALFMKPGSAVVEVRPYGFGGRKDEAAHMNGWLREMLEGLYHWYSIDITDKRFSSPSEAEVAIQGTGNTSIPLGPVRLLFARQRRIRLPYPALRHQLLNIMAVSNEQARYEALVRANAHYVSHDLLPLNRRGVEIPDDVFFSSNMTLFTNADDVRQGLLQLPVNKTGWYVGCC